MKCGQTSALPQDPSNLDLDLLIEDNIGKSGTIHRCCSSFLSQFSFLFDGPLLGNNDCSSLTQINVFIKTLV